MAEERENNLGLAPDTLDLNSAFVSVAQPIEGGAAWVCFDENPVYPTDAVTPMSSIPGWYSLGELSTNGFTEAKSVSSDAKRGWHNTVLLTSESETTETYKAEFLEYVRASVAMLRYGKDNVDVNEDGSWKHLKHGSTGNQTPAFVFDELESNGHLHRTLVKRASGTEFDNVGHEVGNLIYYGMTFTALAPKGGGEAIEEWRAKPASDSPSEPDEDASVPESVNSNSTTAELEAYAKAHGIDLSGCTNNADRYAAIQAAESLGAE
ncbi:MAG: hypothetical protein HFJ65_03410 [Eggerthellaceae bacterium]|nr:hypothetical protein [Eggerthellaceae bacterium]